MIKPLGWISRRNIIISVITLAIAGELTGMIIDLVKFQAKRQLHPYFFSGEIFTGVKGSLRGETFLGYLTDRNIKDDAVPMRFTQAQYALAPTVLDFGNANHRLIILDFQDEKLAFAAAIKLTAHPIKRSPQGIILAERTGL